MAGILRRLKEEQAARPQRARRLLEAAALAGAGTANWSPRSTATGSPVEKHVGQKIQAKGAEGRRRTQRRM
jgi:hypothetical protein